MTLHNATCRAASQARQIRLPICPQCGDMLLAPLLSQHVSARLVHNHWACESCGHTFRRVHAFEVSTIDDDLLAR